MTTEEFGQEDNLATHEIYQVDYHVIFSTETTERFNGSFQIEGNLPNREEVLGYIAGQNQNADWSGAERGSFTVSRLMNNNVHITEEQGTFEPAELISAPSSPAV